MNILIINNSEYLGLGDFINYAFILLFYIKLNFNPNSTSILHIDEF